VLEGRATVEGREVTRQAAAAEDMMQAFFYRHLVPAGDLRLVCGARGISRARPRDRRGTGTVRIAAGGTVRLRAEVSLPPNSPSGRCNTS